MDISHAVPVDLTDIVRPLFFLANSPMCGQRSPRTLGLKYEHTPTEMS